ncbi:hypothetical protein FISHEDRAFT_34651, partial [Fistulina hepatica ATCC 64428]
LLRSLADQNFSTSAAIRAETSITSKAQRNAEGPDDPLATPPVEGGPKTAMGPDDPVSTAGLLEAVDICTDLPDDKRSALERVVLQNAHAFGLDGRLGNYDGLVHIPLKPGTQPISLPPFGASPANRKVIDAQIDDWLHLEVIEPSKSPWAVPVFIVYRNGKPRMVIDL